MLVRLVVAGMLLGIVLVTPLSAIEGMDIVMGTNGDDVIFGDLGQFPGHPLLETTGLHEILYALTAAELLEIGKRLEGENGIESPDDNFDNICGHAGNDIIFAQGGNDWIDGGRGNDIIFAGSGDDLIYYDPDDKFIDGGSGIDVLVAAPNVPSLHKLKENGIVHNIEIMLINEHANFDKKWPGVEITEGKIVLDPSVWQPTTRGPGTYIYNGRPGLKIEVDYGVDIVWKER